MLLFSPSFQAGSGEDAHGNLGRGVAPLARPSSRLCVLDFHPCKEQSQSHSFFRPQHSIPPNRKPGWPKSGMSCLVVRRGLRRHQRRSRDDETAMRNDSSVGTPASNCRRAAIATTISVKQMIQYDHI